MKKEKTQVLFGSNLRGRSNYLYMRLFELLSKNNDLFPENKTKAERELTHLLNNKKVYLFDSISTDDLVELSKKISYVNLTHKITEYVIIYPIDDLLNCQKLMIQEHSIIFISSLRYIDGCHPVKENIEKIQRQIKFLTQEKQCSIIAQTQPRN